MELFPLPLDLKSKNFFYKMFLTGYRIISPTPSPPIKKNRLQNVQTFTKNFKTSFEKKKWIYPNRK